MVRYGACYSRVMHAPQVERTAKLLWRRGEDAAAFTRLELLAALLAIGLLAGLIMAGSSGSQARTKSKRIACVGNLKNLGIGFRVMHSDAPGGGGAGEDGPLIPNLREASAFYESLRRLSNQLGSPKVLVCPSDRGSRQEVSDWAGFSAKGARNRAISYFAMPDARETRPGNLLLGDRSLEARPPLPALSVQAPHAVMGDLGTNRAILASALEWSPNAIHRGEGNVALADGSVQMLTTPRLVESLTGSGDPTNRVVQPGLGDD